MRNSNILSLNSILDTALKDMVLGGLFSVESLCTSAKNDIFPSSQGDLHNLFPLSLSIGMNQ